MPKLQRWSSVLLYIRADHAKCMGEATAPSRGRHPAALVSTLKLENTFWRGHPCQKLLHCSRHVIYSGTMVQHNVIRPAVLEESSAAETDRVG